MSKVGGSESVVRPPPNREIDSASACVCVAFVRAKLREREGSAVTGGGLLQQIGRPSVRAFSLDPPPAAAGGGLFQTINSKTIKQLNNQIIKQSNNQIIK